MAGVPADDDHGGPERWLRRTRTATLGSRDVLRLPDFRRLWAAQGISDVGDGLTMLTLMLLVNQLTGLDPGPGRGRDRAGHPAADDRPRGRDLRGPLGPAPDHARLGQPARRASCSGSSSSTRPRCCRPCWSSRSCRPRSARSSRPPAARSSRASCPAEGLLAANAVTQATRVIAGVVGAGLAGLIVGVLGETWPAFVLDAGTFLLSVLIVYGVDRRAGAPTDSGPCRRRRGRRVAHRRPADRRRDRGRCGSPSPRSAWRCSASVPINVLFLPLLVDVLGVNAAWLGAVDLAQSASMILSASLVGVLAARFRPHGHRHRRA